MTKKLTSFAAFAVMAATPALAQPTLVGTFEGVTPEGSNAFLFEIVSSDLTGSYAVELAFEANIGNSTFFGGQNDTLTDALADEQTTVDNNLNSGYSIAEDTYYFDTNFGTANPGNNPFTSTETTGFVQTPTTLFMSFGTSTDLGSPVSVIRIVTPDDDIEFFGVIAQDGVNNQVSGTAVVPEPTTAALLGLGGLALLSRKRRQA
ncbi:MAG: PEP-CTERM sorting domain-containing protein [Planctomycetota bacterium]